MQTQTEIKALQQEFLYKYKFDIKLKGIGLMDLSMVPCCDDESAKSLSRVMEEEFIRERLEVKNLSFLVDAENGWKNEQKIDLVIGSLKKNNKGQLSVSPKDAKLIDKCELDCLKKMGVNIGDLKYKDMDIVMKLFIYYWAMLLVDPTESEKKVAEERGDYWTVNFSVLVNAVPVESKGKKRKRNGKGKNTDARLSKKSKKKM